MELLIVVVVIAILAAITVVAYNGISGQAKASAVDSTLQQLAKKLERVKIETGAYPADKTAAGIADDSTATYQYAVSNHVQFNTYYLTATNGTLTKHIASGGKPTLGPAPGHTGVSPTTPASGGACPTNYIVVPGNSLFGTEAFCVMKYEAKNNGSGVPVSNQLALPWTSIAQLTAVSVSTTACTGCHLITDSEWLTIAHNVLNVASNWSGGVVGSGYVFSGHNDATPANSLPVSSMGDAYTDTGNASPSNQKRMLYLSNGHTIWDLAGNVWEWTDRTTEGTGGQPGFSTDSSYTGREWAATNLIFGNFASSYPGYGTYQASSWSSSNGIARAFSNSSEPANRAALRGGSHSDSAGAGVLGLSLSRAPSYSATNIGFRVTR